MHPLKQKALLVFFAAAQCLVLYALWPQTKYLLAKKFCIQSPKNTVSKRQKPALLLTAIFNVRRKQKLKQLIVLHCRRI